MKVIALVLIAISSSISIAKAEPNGCYTAQDVESLRESSSTSLNDMRRCLSNFALPEHDPIQIERTANAVAKACAEFLPREKEEDLHSFCYGIYNQNPRAMRAAWQRLSLRELKILQKSYRLVKSTLNEQ